MLSLAISLTISLWGAMKITLVICTLGGGVDITLNTYYERITSGMEKVQCRGISVCMVFGSSSALQEPNNKKYSILVLICISLSTNAVEQLLVC